MLVLLVLACCKWIWFEMMAPDGAGLDPREALADIDLRRAYLLGRVATAEFGVDSLEGSNGHVGRRGLRSRSI